MNFRPLLFLFLFGFFALFSCSNKKQIEEEQEVSADAAFDAYKIIWVEKLWRLNPDWASSQGYHKYDSVLVINTADRRERVLGTYRNMRKELAKHQPKELSVHNQIDLRMMENYLDYATWQDSVFRSYEWDPSVYNIGGSVAEILNGRYDKLDMRLLSISHKLIKAPGYYQTAIANLKKPTLEHTKLAIIQNKGAAEVFGKAMLDSVAKSTLAEREKILLKQRISTAKLAIDGYVSFLENEMLPKLQNNKGRNYRIGKALFAQKFRYEIQASNSSEEIYRKALARKKMLHGQMTKLSRQLWPKYFKDKPMPADSLEMVGEMIV